MESLKKYGLFLYVLAGLLFAWLFYDEQPGLNLLLYEGLLLVFYFVLQRGNINFRTNFFLVVFIAYLVSLFAVIIVNSTFALTLHIILFCLVGGFTYNHTFRSASNLFMSSVEKIFTLPEKTSLENPPKLRWFKYGVVPLFMVGFFVVIYSVAVPNFGKRLGEILDLLQYLNIVYLLLFLLGTILSIFFLKKLTGNYAAAVDAKSNDDLLRKKTKWLVRGLNSGLKREFISALILLVAMNILVSIVLVFDISAYWFNYDLLSYDEAKNIVHKGCYLLIFSIVLSTLIALYLFRGNLNFYPKNALLKQLTTAWLVLNMLMVVSVVIKNIWYIDAYNLAHKRIGVFIFLLATLFGICTVLIKINKRKSVSYLLRLNTAFTGLLLVCCSCFNWDKVIVQYNLSRADKAYIHTLYLVSLDESVFPSLLRHPEILKKPLEWDKKMGHFYQQYAGVDSYEKILQIRLEEYLQRKSKESWKSWNYKDMVSLDALGNSSPSSE